MREAFRAVEALAVLGDARAVPVLEEAAKSKDISGTLRQTIITAINNIKNPAKPEDKKD